MKNGGDSSGRRNNRRYESIGSVDVDPGYLGEWKEGRERSARRSGLR